MKTLSIEGSIRLWAALAVALVMVGVAAAGVEAAANNASVSLKKDSNGLFTLTISDRDGIKSFSLEPATSGPYSGEIRDCPRTFQNTNVRFLDPSDFEPLMPATITDCAGNAEKLEIPPPEDGATKSKRPTPPAPPPALTPEPVPPAAVEPAAEAATPSQRPAASEAETEAAKAKIAYPVAELGDCGSEAACRAYCEELEHIKACVAYAETHGLITVEEAEQGRRFAEIGGSGPGGCTSRESCAAYCEDVSRIEECLDFAEKNSFLSGDELREVRAVAEAKRAGRQFPGGCTTKAACENYCQEASHIDECLSFAEESGLIPPDELAMAKKMLPLIKEGKTPGGCSRKETCEAYCQAPGNMRECLAFAEANGLIPPEELAMAKKFLPLMERGETPGGCRSKEQCEAYCSGEGHFEECLSFGERAGFLSKEDAELARKTGGKGPGGCRSKEQCETYCGDPAHVEECVSFAEQAGLITGEDAELARQAGGMGPGGCRSREECENFCRDPANSEACVAFSVRAGEIAPDEASFAKELNCRSREECIALCQQPENAETCQALIGGPPGGPPGMEGEHGFPPEGEFGPPGIRDELQRRFQEELQRQSQEGIPSEFQSEGRQQFEGETQRRIQEETERRIREETERRIQEESGGLLPPAEGLPSIALPPSDQQRVCPALPTVDQCPTGMQKAVAYSSPECGTYYACIPESNQSTTDVTAPPPASDDPARRCVESGGSWDGTACILSSSPSSALPAERFQQGVASALESVWGFFGFR